MATETNDQGDIVMFHPGKMNFTGHPPTVWVTGNFARKWLEDTRNAATSDGDRRHEIVFALCFVESYLVEWVRDQVFKRAVEKTDQFFAETVGQKGKHERIRDRLKTVLTELVKRGLIDGKPTFQGTWWQDFLLLVQYRNWLVHGVASTPESEDRLLDADALLTSFNKLTPEWALRTALEVIRHLHDAAGTTPEPWLSP